MEGGPFGRSFAPFPSKTWAPPERVLVKKKLSSTIVSGTEEEVPGHRPLPAPLTINSGGQ